MTRTTPLIFALATACLAPAASSAAAPPNRQSIPQLGSCRAGECSWTRERARDEVRADRAGRLLRVNLLGGTSRHRGENYPDHFNRSVRIDWNARAHDIYVFCSPTLPSVMVRVGDHYQVDVLDFAGGNIPDMLFSSAAIYARTCHPGARWTDANFARRYRYVRALPASAGELVVQDPRQIFGYAH